MKSLIGKRVSIPNFHVEGSVIKVIDCDKGFVFCSSAGKIMCDNTRCYHVMLVILTDDFKVPQTHFCSWKERIVDEDKSE